MHRVEVRRVVVGHILLSYSKCFLTLDLMNIVFTKKSCSKMLEDLALGKRCIISLDIVGVCTGKKIQNLSRNMLHE